MMKSCRARAALRSVCAALMLVAALLVKPVMAPSDTLAATAERRSSQPSTEYLDQLLHEINGRRATIGSPPLSYAAPSANAAVGRYLADLTPLMMATHACFHGMHDPVAPGWDYVVASGLNGEARGEVIGCPMEGYQWTPQQVAGSWWASPAHFRLLYGDPHANVVACGGYGAGRRGFATVACVTFRV